VLSLSFNHYASPEWSGAGYETVRIAFPLALASLNQAVMTRMATIPPGQHACVRIDILKVDVEGYEDVGANTFASSMWSAQAVSVS
jgi:hypothetical protein